jgi:nucleotide-binding universal stress UspA family protein
VTERPVLIGCDAGLHSRDAVALGRILAQLLAAPIELVCVYPYTPLAGRIVPDPWVHMTERDADQVLARARAELGEAQEASVRRIAASGPALGLELAAEETDAEIIVVGPTGRSALGRALPGSTGVQVLTSAPCPVAVARAGDSRNATVPASIGVGYDGSDESSLAVELAGRLAAAGGAALVVVGVLHPSVKRADPARYEAHERLDRIAAGLPVDAEARVLTGAPERCLTALSEAVDLVVVGSRGRGALPRALLGSVSARLMRHAACPVVSVPKALAVSAASRATGR